VVVIFWFTKPAQDAPGIHAGEEWAGLVNVWDLARLRLAGFITGSKIGRIADPQKTLHPGP
jgi:hypothetical protein